MATKNGAKSFVTRAYQYEKDDTTGAPRIMCRQLMLLLLLKVSVKKTFQSKLSVIVASILKSYAHYGREKPAEKSYDCISSS